MHDIYTRCPVCGEQTDTGDKRIITPEADYRGGYDTVVGVIWHYSCYLAVRGNLPDEFRRLLGHKTWRGHESHNY